MKRSDLTTQTVLGAVNIYGVNAWEFFTMFYPPKVILAAFQREVDADRLDYGVSLRRPFLTDQGRAWLGQHTRQPSEIRHGGPVDRPGEDDLVPLVLLGCQHSEICPACRGPEPADEETD